MGTLSQRTAAARHGIIPSSRRTWNNSGLFLPRAGFSSLGFWGRGQSAGRSWWPLLPPRSRPAREPLRRRPEPVRHSRQHRRHRLWMWTKWPQGGNKRLQAQALSRQKLPRRLRHSPSLRGEMARHPRPPGQRPPAPRSRAARRLCISPSMGRVRRPTGGCGSLWYGSLGPSWANSPATICRALTRWPSLPQGHPPRVRRTCGGR